MISRDVNQLHVVPALTHNARFHSCTVAGFTCYTDGATSAIGTSEFFPGYIIDRLGLPASYRSIAVVPVVFGTFGSTGAGAGDILIGTLSAGVMHASASGGTFAAYSTGNWLVGAGLWRQTTATSTAHGNFTQLQRDVGYTCQIGIGGLTSTTTSTTDGVQDVVAGTSSTSFFWYGGPPAVFSLDGAKRFIKVALRTQFETTACGSGAFHMSAAAVFGEPDLAAAQTLTKRAIVTSGCST